MRSAIEAGNVFGRMTAILQIGLVPNGTKAMQMSWMFMCDCGKHVVVPSYRITSGKAKSCGCLASERMSEYKKAHPTPAKHGHTVNGKWSRTYITWSAMLQRCNYEKNKRFKDYGGRGIKVCERWNSFENFLEDMGERPTGMTIDRIDVNGNYEVANCRWATSFEQAANKRKPNLIGA